MAYTSKTLSVLGYANGFTLWHYGTPDAAAEVMKPDYFERAAEMMRVGDFVLVNSGINSNPQHCVLVVARSENGHVDLADLTPAPRGVDLACPADIKAA